MILSTIVLQDHHAPKTNLSGRPGTVQIGLIVASRYHGAWQPPWAYNKLLARVSSTLSTERHRTCEVKRTHANKVNVRLTTGATGHEEGNAIFIRWPNSCTRAPSLSKRT
jgi:hypothetical protein